MMEAACEAVSNDITLAAEFKTIRSLRKYYTQQVLITLKLLQAPGSSSLASLLIWDFLAKFPRAIS